MWVQLSLGLRQKFRWILYRLHMKTNLFDFFGVRVLRDTFLELLHEQVLKHFGRGVSAGLILEDETILSVAVWLGGMLLEWTALTHEESFFLWHGRWYEIIHLLEHFCRHDPFRLVKCDRLMFFTIDARHGSDSVHDECFLECYSLWWLNCYPVWWHVQLFAHPSLFPHRGDLFNMLSLLFLLLLLFIICCHLLLIIGLVQILNVDDLTATMAFHLLWVTIGAKVVHIFRDQIWLSVFLFFFSVIKVHQCIFASFHESLSSAIFIATMGAHRWGSDIALDLLIVGLTQVHRVVFAVLTESLNFGSFGHFHVQDVSIDVKTVAIKLFLLVLWAHH